MNMHDHDPLNEWKKARAEAAPSDELVERAKAAMLSVQSDGEEVDFDSALDSPGLEPSSLQTEAPQPARGFAWERSLQRLTERSWGGLAICAAALVLGVTPYIGAMVVLHR